MNQENKNAEKEGLGPGGTRKIGPRFFPAFLLS